jgi:large subunit ribosomal protein L10
MDKQSKERVVSELVERLQSTDTLIVADYRGLTMKEIDALRGELLKHGARFAVVKNTLTRRAAEEAGAEALLALLEGPTAIAFLESEGDPVAVAKALGDTARTTHLLAIRGGVLEGRPMSADEVENLAKLPPIDILRGQVLGAVTAPLTAIFGLFTAPLQDLYGLIDARIEQLGGVEANAPVAEPVDEPAAEAEAEAPTPEAVAEPEAEAAAPEAPAAAEDPVVETTEEAPQEEE